MTHARRCSRRFRALALAMSTACALAPAAGSAQIPALPSSIVPRVGPQPLGHPSKEEQEAFDREAKLMPLAHQRALAIVDQVMADLNKLNARLEPELVNQTVTDRGAALHAQPTGPDRAGNPRWECREPPQVPTRFTTKEAFDTFAKKRLDSIALLRAHLVERYEFFTRLTQQDQKTILETRGRYEQRGDARALGELAFEMREMQKSENVYYQEQYWTAALALLNLWRAEQSEAANVGGWPNYFTLMELMSDKADRSMSDLKSALGFWECVEESYSVPSPLGHQEPGAQRASAQWKGVRQDCLRETVRLRDEFATELRELRARLIVEGLDIRRRLTDWRAAGIAEHFYIGDGPEAISAVFKDPVPRPLGALKPFEGTFGFVADWISGDVTDYTVSIYAGACGSVDGDNDEAAYVIRYPDVEMPRAYSFRIEFDAPTVLERIVSGVGAEDRL